MIGVLAPHREHFLFWCRENLMQPDREAKHLTRLEIVQGVHFDELTKTGPYWTCPVEHFQAFAWAEQYQQRMRACRGIRSTKTV